MKKARTEPSLWINLLSETYDIWTFDNAERPQRRVYTTRWELSIIFSDFHIAISISNTGNRGCSWYCWDGAPLIQAIDTYGAAVKA